MYKRQAIITVSKSGETARLLSKYRPETPVIACVMADNIYRQLSLSWGITPLKMGYAHNTDELIEMAVETAEKAGYVESGDLVVLTAGVPVGISGTTNMIKAHLVGNVLISGVGEMCIRDSMSMYGVNASVPKTLVRHIVATVADTTDSSELRDVLRDILDTPVSPELLPAKDGIISQQTEEIVGPYDLHDFFLYYAVRWGFSPAKVFFLAQNAFRDQFEDAVILKWLRKFYWRFFSQQFKRSCVPDGPKVGTVTLSPRGDWRMPSDACAAAWIQELDHLEQNKKEG